MFSLARFDLAAQLRRGARARRRRQPRDTTAPRNGTRVALPMIELGDRRGSRGERVKPSSQTVRPVAELTTFRRLRSPRAKDLDGAASGSRRSHAGLVLRSLVLELAAQRGKARLVDHLLQVLGGESGFLVARVRV